MPLNPNQDRIYDFYYSVEQNQLARNFGYPDLKVNGKRYSEAKLHPSQSNFSDAQLILTEKYSKVKIEFVFAESEDNE